MKVQAFVDKPFSFSIDQHTKNIAVFLKLIANSDITKFGCISVPSRRVAPRPIPVGCCTYVKRHLEAIALVEARTSDFGQFPARAQIARPHLWIGLKTTTSQHNRLGHVFCWHTFFKYMDPFDLTVFIDQRSRSCIELDQDARLFGRLIQKVDQACASPRHLNGQSAKEATPAIDHARLTTKIGNKLDAFASEPDHGL